MKVLVIDDKPIHHLSAIQTLTDHQVTIVGTYDEAHALLQVPRAPWQAVNAELERRGFKKGGYDPNETEQERMAKELERERIEQELCPPPPFDAVLSDLLMPASGMMLAPEPRKKYEGQEMPVGFALAFMAVRSGAKYVAIVTDIGHHDHPASAMLDTFVSDPRFRPDSYPSHGFIIDGVKIGFYQQVSTWVEGTTCLNCNGTGEKEICFCVERNAGTPEPSCGGCEGTGYECWDCRNSGKLRGKDWGRVLTHLSNPDALKES